MRRKTEKYRAEIRLEGKPIPVEAYLERRPSVRFGITKRGVSIRLPHGIKQEEIHSELARLEIWVGTLVEQKPDIRELLLGPGKTYQTGDVLQVGKRQYTLHVNVEERETHSARLERGGLIVLSISQKSDPKHREKAIKQLLSRVVAADFQHEITRRVLDLNKRHFNQEITSVNLKYNHSNWGSCSTRKNVNLSTRLLFAPEDVQDYVIIHELAHLLEMNHSDRFWALVARAMPDYEEKERWLKKHGKTCDF